MPRTLSKPSDLAFRFGGAAAVGALLLALSAHAQNGGQQTPAQSGQSSSDSASSQSSSSDNTTVTIVGQKPPVQHKIDRDVYDVSKDPQAQTGSASDVLQNVPSVSVDNQGNVALRGNSNVKVYVNGKPSAEMEGDNRATALDAMSGGDIDSVEVITNPSAQFGADTGGGIINLVLKRNRRPGASGNVRVNLGDNGRYNTAFSGNYTKGPMTLSLSLSKREDVRTTINTGENIRTDPVTGAVTDFKQNGVGTTPRDSNSINLGMDYNLSDYDTLSLSANGSHNPLGGINDSHTVVIDAAGATTQDYQRNSRIDGAQNNDSLQAQIDHRGKSPGEDLKVTFRHSESGSNTDTNYIDTYAVPAQPDALDRVEKTTDTRIDDFSGDYVHPVGDTQALGAGWDLQVSNADYINYRSLSHAPGTPEVADSNYTNHFRLGQTVSALYFTWQTPLGHKWNALFGLRAEDTNLDVEQLTSGLYRQVNYLNWSPSLHLTYPLSDSTNLRLSYTHKIRRPISNELNPFITYRDAFDVSAGNPNLKPQQIDSYEAKVSGKNWSGGVYYNYSTHTIITTDTYLSNSVLLTTQENGGRSQSVGGEYQFNANLTKTIAFDASLNVYYQKLDSVDPFTHLPAESKGTSYSNRGRVTWSPTPKDQFQAVAIFNGPRLQAQGNQSGFNMLNLTYTRILTPKLKLLVTDNDALNSMKFHSAVRNSNIDSVRDINIQGRVIYIGLSYSFGGAKDRGGWGGGNRGGGGNWGGPGGGGAPGGGGGYGGGGF